MSKLDFQIDQVGEDTALVIIRGDFTRFTSLDQAKKIRHELSEWQEKIGQPIMFIDKNLEIEKLNDQQLLELGLQRIKSK